MSHQLSKAVESATAPFQYAMTTKAGTECIAHALQALTESNPQCTIMTVDGIGAFDQISRASMLGALRDVEGGSQALPFVRLFHGQPSRYLWEDSVGVVHLVDQGEGGEQGDAMMPLLFSLGQHAALQAVQGRLDAGERLMAFLDDVYVATPTPDRVGPIYTTLDVDLYRHARIRINGGKTQVWNAAGIRPRACDEVERIAQEADPTARVWRGSHLPLVQQGITVLGTPLGSVEFVQAHLQKTLADHDTLLSRIPLLDDTQSAWALLLHCAGSRANYLLRVIRPELVRNFAEGHNAGLWRCLAQILPASTGADPIAKATASLPLSTGGLGLRDASRTSEPAFWASWADCLSIIRKRHPEVALEMVRQLNARVLLCLQHPGQRES